MENLEQIVNNNSNNGGNIERHPIDKKIRVAHKSRGARIFYHIYLNSRIDKESLKDLFHICTRFYLESR